MLTKNPAQDEFEVSIFGPGVGECVVLHLGRGKWMIIDSCLDQNTKQPVALDYLGALNVDVANDVAAIVVTHWHDDHTRGASAVLRACAKASFFCSSAVGRREFFQLVAAAQQLELRAEKGSGIDEMARVFAVLEERLKRSEGRFPSPEYAAAQTIIFRAEANEKNPGCVVEALSPSSTSVTRGMLSFAPRLMSAKKAIPNPGPNELSVALHVEFGEFAALLGADLELGSSDGVGWRAVVRNSRRPTRKATVIKVPHHGSAGADDPEAWSALVGQDAHAAVTSYTSSQLPRESDLHRIRPRVARLFHSSASKSRAIKFDPATERSLEGIRIRERAGTMGHIRFRAKGAALSCELFGAAREV